MGGLPRNLSRLKSATRQSLLPFAGDVFFILTHISQTVFETLKSHLLTLSARRGRPKGWILSLHALVRCRTCDGRSVKARRLALQPVSFSVVVDRQGMGPLRAGRDLSLEHRKWLWPSEMGTERRERADGSCGQTDLLPLTQECAPSPF